MALPCETPDGKPKTDFTVDSSGDVILRVGSENPYNIQVSSKALSLASDVFAAMFSNRFREGQELRANQLDGCSPVSVKVAEDEKDAMLLCCNIIHFQINSSSSVPGPQALVDLAVLADKYNCIQALWPLSDHWIDSHIARATAKGLTRLLLVSYLLGTSTMFLRVTKSFTEYCDKDLSQIATGPEYEILPLSLYCMSTVFPTSIFAENEI